MVHISDLCGVCDGALLEPRDAHDSAIVGHLAGIVVYDREKLIGTFMHLNPGWLRSEADEWISFNVEGSMFDGAPVVMEPVEQ